MRIEQTRIYREQRFIRSDGKDTERGEVMGGDGR